MDKKTPGMFIRSCSNKVPTVKKISVRDLLNSQTQKYTDKTFLIDPENERQFTYSEFNQKANLVSNFLWNIGIRKNDKVALFMPNSPEFLLSYFGIMQICAIACPINIHLKAEEIGYILDNSDSIAVITCKEYLPLIDISLKRDNKIQYLLSADNLSTAFAAKKSVQLLELNFRLEKESTKLLPEVKKLAVDPDDVAQIIYTSGTTGRPRGVMLTHHNLLINSRWISHWNNLNETDRAMCVMPLFHVNGQMVTVLAPLYHGGSLVLPKKFSVTDFFSTINKYEVTYTGTVATMLSMLLNRDNSQGFSSESKLRIVFCGSAPVPTKVQVEFEKAYGVPVIEGYGMTETTCRSTFNPLPPFEALKLGENDGYRKIGSVGLPLGNEIKVVDDDHTTLGPNKVGEIVIRGENVMKGYYKNPTATVEAFKDGWFHSGDLGYYDEAGYFYIIDRKKDMIIRGGENIYPREIDEVLYKHPAVKDAACIGIPDELYGEEVVAFVVLKEEQMVSGNDIILFCRQHLADFKVPKKINIIKEIPKGPSGKLLRRMLREKWDCLNNKSVGMS